MSTATGQTHDNSPTPVGVGSGTLVSHSAKPRWTYSVYRAALRLDGNTVALLTPDGRNAFGNGQVQPLLDLLNNQSTEATDRMSRLLANK